MDKKAIHLIKKSEGKLELDEKPLQELFNSERAKNCVLAIISVAGLLRKGKSFLLSLFVRFLLKGSVENWLDDLDEKSEGFAWQNGSDAHTDGILIWPEIFYYKKSDGEEVGIILMDTQGCFDTDTILNENVSIFAYSTMLASVQIYNLMQSINENDLQNLQLFAEFGKNASQHSTDKPFQKLIFLIRDWSDKKNYPYGENGGQKYLQKQVLQKKEREELEMTRNSIASCFDTCEGFLLPHPGLDVAQDFDGDLNKLTPDFREYVKKLVTFVLSPENVVVKQINGSQVKGKLFLELVSSYWNVFKNGEMPEIKVVFIAMVEASCNSASKIVQDMYTRNMDACLPATNAFSELLLSHNCYVEESMKTFIEKATLGNDLLRKPFQENLSTYFQNCFTVYTGLFEKRNASEAEKQRDKDELQKLKDKSQQSKLVSDLAATMMQLGTLTTAVNPIAGVVLLGSGALVRLVSEHREEIASAAEKLKDITLNVALQLSKQYITSAEDKIHFVCEVLQKEYTEHMDAILSLTDINFKDLGQSHNEYVDKAKHEFYENTDGIGEDLKDQILEKLLMYFQDCFMNYFGLLETSGETKDEIKNEKQMYIENLQKLKEIPIYKTTMSTSLEGTGMALIAASPLVGGVIVGASMVLNALEARRNRSRAADGSIIDDN